MFRKYCVVQFLESSKLILPEMQTQCSFKTPSATDACHHHGVEVAKQLDAKYHFGLCWAGGPKVYCRKGVVFCFGSLVVGLLETESSSTRLGFPGAHCVAQAVRTHTWPTMLTVWSQPLSVSEAVPSSYCFCGCQFFSILCSCIESGGEMSGICWMKEK